MIIPNLTISEAKQYKAQDPTCHVVLQGLAATIYTGLDVEKSLRWLSPTEFRDRFTEDEMMLALSKADTDINIKLLLFKLQTAPYLGLDTKDVIDGVNYLAYINVIDKSRVNDILM